MIIDKYQDKLCLLRYLSIIKGLSRIYISNPGRRDIADEFLKIVLTLKVQIEHISWSSKSYVKLLDQGTPYFHRFIVAIDWFLIFLCFNATFSNISAISWRPVLVVEEAGDVTHDIGDQWRNVKSGINQDTLQNALQSKVILPVFSL